MSFAFDDVSCGGQLQVGTGVVPAIGQGDNKINGSAHVEGPMVVGPPQAYPAATATMMVGPLANDDPDCPTVPHALMVSGGTPNAVMVVGDMYVTGKVDCLYKGRLLARFNEADKKPKPFDMVHPSRGEGHRLRYACIEGPEAGVYYRGRVRNKNNVITLPNYWKDLVHTDSISVQLQPIGAHQNVIVKRWDDSHIYLQAQGGMPVDCFFHVYAERKDVNKLITEYEGDSWKEYPDPEYDDPKYGGQNIVTG